jgi:hypothetical protein
MYYVHIEAAIKQFAIIFSANITQFIRDTHHVHHQLLYYSFHINKVDIVYQFFFFCIVTISFSAV